MKLISVEKQEPCVDNLFKLTGQRDSSIQNDYPWSK